MHWNDHLAAILAAIRLVFLLIGVAMEFLPLLATAAVIECPTMEAFEQKGNYVICYVAIGIHVSLTDSLVVLEASHCSVAKVLLLLGFDRENWKNSFLKPLDGVTLHNCNLKSYSLGWQIWWCRYIRCESIITVFEAINVAILPFGNTWWWCFSCRRFRTGVCRRLNSKHNSKWISKWNA